MSFDLLSNINKSKERILKLQAQLATMNRVLKPSDDPQAAQMIMRLNGMLDRNAQYQKNVAEGNASTGVVQYCTRSLWRGDAGSAESHDSGDQQPRPFRAGNIRGSY